MILNEITHFTKIEKHLFEREIQYQLGDAAGRHVISCLFGDNFNNFFLFDKTFLKFIWGNV